MSNAKCEQEYEFVLTLGGVDELNQSVEDKLYEAGCDDATLGIRYGRLYLAFCRQSPSFEDAVLSAIDDVSKSGVGQVLQVDDCNLVTQAEIARRMNRSRQLVSQYISGKRGPGGFPSPECHIVDESPLWLWCEVASWLWVNGMISEDELKKAEVTYMVNQALDTRRPKRPAEDKELESRVNAAILEAA